MCDFITHSSTIPFLDQFANSVICVLQSDILSSLMAMVTKEKSSDQNRKEDFCETAFRCVNANHRVTGFSALFSLPTQFYGNLQWDNFERNEAYGGNGNILR